MTEPNRQGIAPMLSTTAMMATNTPVGMNTSSSGPTMDASNAIAMPGGSQATTPGYNTARIPAMPGNNVDNRDGFQAPGSNLQNMGGFQEPMHNPPRTTGEPPKKRGRPPKLPGSTTAPYTKRKSAEKSAREMQLEKEVACLNGVFQTLRRQHEETLTENHRLREEYAKAVFEISDYRNKYENEIIESRDLRTRHREEIGKNNTLRGLIQRLRNWVTRLEAVAPPELIERDETGWNVEEDDAVWPFG